MKILGFFRYLNTMLFFFKKKKSGRDINHSKLKGVFDLVIEAYVLFNVKIESVFFGPSRDLN